MSGVYKAVDRRKVEGRADDPHVAVKLLALSFADHSAALAVLQREAAKLQSLAHPNIVRAIDCDRDGEIVFMTMEFLEGESLAKKLAGSGLPAPEALAILESVASALAFAHSQGILHGDFKPGNVHRDPRRRGQGHRLRHRPGDGAVQQGSRCPSTGTAGATCGR